MSFRVVKPRQFVRPWEVQQSARPTVSISDLAKSYWIRLIARLRKLIWRPIRHQLVAKQIAPLKTQRSVWEFVRSESEILESIVDLSEPERIKLLHHLYRAFAGRVTILPRQHALVQAQEESVLSDLDYSVLNSLVFWADGSRVEPYRAIGVVWRISTMWHSITQPLADPYTMNEVEMLAISAAIKVAHQIVFQPESTIKVAAVRIYSDSTAALQTFESFHDRHIGRHGMVINQLELARAKQRVRELHRKGVTVELRYVPGHSGIPGNLRADTAARAGIQMNPQMGSSPVDPAGYLDYRSAAIANLVAKPSSGKYDKGERARRLDLAMNMRLRLVRFISLAYAKLPR